MFNVERILQILLACLVILGATLLGFGNENFSFSLLVAAAVIGSLLATDIFGVFSFNRHVANLAAILAAIYSVADFLTSNSDHQLMAMAGLLVYLQIVLLFQKKTPRIYWQLMVLSVLQVVVAAALRLEIEAGFLFVIYMFLAVLVMSMLHLHRESLRLKDQESSRSMPNARGQLVHGRSAESLLRGEPWARFDIDYQGTQYVASIIRIAILLALISGVFASVMFFVTPRSENVWYGPENVGLRMIGFGRNIRFNISGKIEVNENVVFRATYVDPVTEREVEMPAEEIYLRGIALNHYAIARGVPTWITEYGYERDLSPNFLTTAPANEKVVLQKVVLEPMADSMLFTAYPCYIDEDTPREVRIEPRNQTIARYGNGGDSNASKPYRYDLLVGGIRSGMQLTSYPFLDRSGEPVPMTQLQAGQLTTLYEPKFPQLIETADRVVGTARDSKSRMDVARALSDHLRYSQEFRYTLDFTSVSMNGDIDPIEDFLANHKSGHCEYFAGALALMLRSQGIPCRVILGFKGGRYNSVGKYYEFRQNDCHAWVEAYLRPEDCNSRMQRISAAGPGGAWLRLDPTPSVSDELEVDSDAGLLAQADDAMDYAQLLWDDYVVSRNDSSIMDSRGGIMAGVARLLNADSWERRIRELESRLGFENHSDATRIQIALALGFGLFAVYYWNPFRRRKSVSESTSPTFLQKLLGDLVAMVSNRDPVSTVKRGEVSLVGPPVDFYERFTGLMRQLGMERDATQTQLEFVRDVDVKCANDDSPSMDRPEFQAVARGFYQVRFGKTTLDKQQSDEIEHALSWLEAHVRARGANGAATHT